MNNPIGVLDSGVGGLTIWKEIAASLPNESTIYIADSKNCPYGSRSQEEIYSLSRRLVQFLIEKQCKLIVVACNTITVSCLEQLRGEFKSVPIVGAVPVVKTASEKSRNKRIGILSTTATADSQYQRDLINRFARDCEVTAIGTDKLAPLIEQGEIHGSKQVDELLKEVLQPFIDGGIDMLALGCSHFPLVKNQIQKILTTRVKIFDSAGAIARHVKRVLLQANLQNIDGKLKHDFYTTGDKGKFLEVLRLMGYNNSVHSIEL